MLGHTIRFVWRSLGRRPGYSFACVATLGIAIGVALAVVLLADIVLSRPVALDPRAVSLLRLVGTEFYGGFTHYEWEYVRGSTEDSIFEAVAGSGDLSLYVTTPSGAAESVRASFVTGGFFDVVGSGPALGRRFDESEYRAGAAPVAIVTHAFWQSRLGGDRSVIGQHIQTGDLFASVVGVMPPTFRGLRLDDPVDMLMPLPMARLLPMPRNLFHRNVVDGNSPEAWISITGRLQVSAAVAESRLAELLRERGEAQQESVRVVPATAAALSPRSRSTMRQFLAMLVVASGLMLLAGCANVAGALLVRNEQRRREMFLRLCLGAGRGELARLCLAEVLLLTGFGSLLGAYVAVLIVRAAGSFSVLPDGIDIAHLQVGGITHYAVMTAAAAVVTAGICGLFPALQFFRGEIRNDARAGWWRGIALSAQVAAVVVLLTGAALFLRSARDMLADVVMDDDGLVYTTVHFLNSDGYRDPVVAENVYDRVLERLKRMPGVASVTFGDLPRVTNNFSLLEVHVDGEMRWLPKRMQVFFGGPDYAPVVGLRMLAERDLGDDDRDGAPRVVVVSASLARHLWGDEAPLGRRMEFLPLTMPVQVAGVVRDGRYARLRDPEEFAVFLPWRQHRALAAHTGAVIVRAERDGAALVPVVQRVVQDVAPGLRITASGTVSDSLRQRTRPLRTGAALLGGLSVFALLLAIVGIHGAVTHAIVSRRRELGIRRALGATGRDIAKAALGGPAVQVGIGIAAGAGVAHVLAIVASSYLLIGPHPATQGMVLATVAAIAVGAALVPLLRVTSAASTEKLMKDAVWAE